MSDVISLNGQTTTEKIIEKSRFITFSSHIESEEEAKELIIKIKKENPFATHNCYAYIADKIGNLMRYSDDGEPSGTAGVPMLEVLKNNKLFEVLVVVTRYFGGIKLGAGGLVRAYSSCVAENLNASQKTSFKLCKIVKIKIFYDSVTPLKRFLSQNNLQVLKEEYLNEVNLIVAVKNQEYDEFIKSLNDYLSGNVVTEIIEEKYISFNL